MMGQTITSTIMFEDYKEVDGVKVPFTFKQTIGPQEIISKLDEVLINKDVSDEDFK